MRINCLNLDLLQILRKLMIYLTVRQMAIVYGAGVDFVSHSQLLAVSATKWVTNGHGSSLQSQENWSMIWFFIRSPRITTARLIELFVKLFFSISKSYYFTGRRMVYLLFHWWPNCNADCLFVSCYNHRFALSLSTEICK